MEVPIEGIQEEDDGEVAVHQQDDSDVSVEEYEFNRCIKTVKVTNLSPSVGRAQLGVVRYTLASLSHSTTGEGLSYFKLVQKLKTRAAR